MLPPGFDILPGVDGDLFTGSHSTAVGINRPRWAKITGSDGQFPVRYSWEEQTFQQLPLGSQNSLGLSKMDGGMFGLTNLNPVVDPNGSIFNVGDFVLVQQAYFDPAYEFGWAVVGGASGGGSGGKGTRKGGFFAKCVTTTPVGGRYDARQQLANADGTLSDSGSQIWLRDCNNTNSLNNGEIYPCSLTGFSNSRFVFTTNSVATPVSINTSSPANDGTYDATVQSIDGTNPAAPAIVPGIPVWFWDPNKPGALVTSQIYFAEYAGVYNGRPLYVRDDFRLNFQYDDGSTVTDFVQTVQLKKKDFVFPPTLVKRLVQVTTRGWPANVATGEGQIVIGPYLTNVSLNIDTCVLSLTYRTQTIDVTDGLIQNTAG